MPGLSDPRTWKRAIAALAVAAAALVAAPAAAQTTITIGDGVNPAAPALPVCPRDNGTPPTGATAVDAFTLRGSAAATVGRVEVKLVPADAYLNVDRIVITDSGSQVLGTYTPGPVGSGTYQISLTTPISVTTSDVTYYVAVVPKQHQDMPPPALGISQGIKATLTRVIGSGIVVAGSDAASSTVTLDNGSPANVDWELISATPNSITLDWAATPTVVVLRREFGPVESSPVEGATYAAATDLGTSRVVFSGSGPLYTDPGLQARPYYYRLFTRDTCGNYSSGVALGPITPGAPSEGDLAQPSVNPVVGIVTPVSGPVTRPFKVQIRAWSPAGVALTEVRLYGNRGSGDELLATTQTSTLTRNSNYNSTYGAGADSGLYEFVAPVGFAAGAWTLRAWASNAADRVAGVYSGGIGVSVGATAGDGKLLVRDNSNQLCVDCHKVKTHSSEATGMGLGSWFVACRTCHDPHGTTNAKLIASQITPPAVNGTLPPTPVFYKGVDGNTPGGKANASGTGLCQVCHTRTQFYARGVQNETHGDGQACAACHSHKDGQKAGCSSCHGSASRTADPGVTWVDSLLVAAPPVAPTTAAPIVAGGGLHLAHVNRSTYRRDALACSNCHLGYAHADGDVDLGWGPLAVGNGVKTVAPVPAAGPTTAGWVGAPGCTNYCHGASLSDGVAATKVAVSWGAATPLTCGSCHGAPPALKQDGLDHPVDPNCETCHGTGYLVSGIVGGARTTHIDGVLQASNCTGCHGTDGVNAAPPVAANPVGPNNVGAHQAHVTQTNFRSSELQCSDCHAQFPTNHNNQSQNVAFGALAKTGSMFPDYLGSTTPATPTCASTYCHAGAAGGTTPAPNWNTAGTLGCNSCHGNSPGYPHPGNQTCADCHPSAGGETYAKTGATTGTVAKATHLDGTVTRSTSGCTSCHGTLSASGVNLLVNTSRAAPGFDAVGSEDTMGGTTSAAPGVGAHRTHLTSSVIRPGGAAICTDCHALPPTDVDTAHAAGAGTGGARATIDFTAGFGNTAGQIGGYAGSNSGAAGSTAGNCSNTYCHGGKYTTAPYQGAIPAPSWSGGAMTCGSCHLGPPTSQAHTSVNATKDCGDCHAGWVCTMDNQAGCNVPTTHLDGTFQTVTVTCTLCHGTNGVNAAPPVAVNSPAGPNAIGAHQAHVTSGNITTTLTCDECHQPVSALNSTNHSNGTVNTQFTTTRSTGTSWRPGAAPADCTTSYCHGGTAAQSGWGRTQGDPQWNTVDGRYQNCNSCHGVPPALNASSHHPPNSATACSVCHTGYTSTTINAGQLASHVDGTINYRAGCTACHGDTTVSGANNADNRSAPGYNLNAIDIAGATSGTRVGAHAAHLSGTRLRTTLLGCGECHTVPATNDLNHADGLNNSTGARSRVDLPGTLANGTVGGGANTNPSFASGTCSNVYCHGARYVGRTGYTGTNMAPGWTQNTATAATCGNCHAAAPTAGSTHNAANAGTEACSVCHTTYVSCTKANNFATCQIPVEHMNGTFDAPAGGCGMCHGNPPATVTLTAPFVGATHPQNPTCGSCHGAGYNTTDYASLPGSHGGTTVPGTDGPNNGCTACHGVLAGPTAAGAAPGVTAAPGYYTGATYGADSAGSTATSYTAVGAHDAHVRKTNLRSAALPCSECHNGFVPGAGNVDHANGNVDTGWGTLATSAGQITNANWNGTGCSMTYCHGNFTNGKDQLSGGPPTTPAQVTGLSSPSQTYRSITLSWAAVTGAVLYKVERSPSGTAGTYVQVGTTTNTTYVDDGLWDGTTYWYQVRAWNTATVGDGAYSTPLSQGTTGGAGAPTARVYNWQWTSTGSFDGLTANLPASSCGDTVYPTSTTARVTTMSTAANACTERFYTTAGGTANMPILTIVLSTPYAAATAISAPSLNWNVRVSTTNTTIATQLGYVESGTFYGFGSPVQTALTTTIEAVSPNMASQTGTVPQNASLAVRFTRVPTDTNEVRFYFSNTVGATNVTESPVAAPPPLPSAPTGTPANPRITGMASNSLTVAWDPVANASTYKVERSPNGTNGWVQVAQPATTSVTNGGLASTTRYYYRVRASNPGGDAASYSANAWGDTTAAVPAGQISWTGAFTPASTTLTCTSCHGNPPLGTHPTSANACSTCHPNYDDNTASPQDVDKAVHMNGVVNVDCVGCHSSQRNNRDPIVAEFSMTWSHKASAAGKAVTKWDCVVCHMEGNVSDGERSLVHGDGNINLRDPDTGYNIKQVAFTGARGNTSAGSYGPVGGDPDMVFTTFRRNLAVALDNDPDAARVQAIMVNQCLKCHDADGALAFNASLPLNGMVSQGGVTRSAGKPFGTTIPGAGYNGGTTDGGSSNTACASGTNGCVANVKDSFATGSNSSYHPVLGRNNNWFARATRMVTPWNLAKINTTTANATEFGFLMSCWDCHAAPADSGTITRTVTAHGGANTLRGTATVSGTPSSTNAVTLCVKCHANYNNTGTNYAHGTGSAFATDTGRSTKGPYLQFGCNLCHSSGYRTATAATRPVRAKNSHGVNALPTYTTGAVTLSGRWASATAANKRPFAFIRAIDTLGDHEPRVATGTTLSVASTCDMRGTATGGPSCDQGSENLGPGGTY